MLEKRYFTVEVDRESGPPSAFTLPGVLELLSAGESVNFVSLRPHQQHAWHAFLVQCAALVLFQDADHRPIELLEESDWAEGLLRLGGVASSNCWSLVVDDLSQPAFLQNPVPEGSLAAYKGTVQQPDELDIVVTTRNHDVKQERLGAPSAEHWVYSLLALQTMQGFFGAGNYGIARMNGGFSSRPGLGAAPGISFGPRFKRDVAVLLAHRPSLTSEDAGHGYPDKGGLALCWLHPWGGKDSISPSVLDPFFIEVCRRVRLLWTGKWLVARTASSKKAFLDAKSLNGDTGDIWTPIQVDVKATKALTVSSNGFDYRLVSDLLLSGDFRSREALRITDHDGEAPVLIAQVLVRGQGTTDGYRERYLPLSKKAAFSLGTSAGRERLGEVAQRRIERARDTQLKVLKPAILILLQGGPEDINFRDDRADPWIQSFDREIDRAFFQSLWETLDMDDDYAIDQSWDNTVLGYAAATFEDSAQAVTIPQSTKERAYARAQMAFWASARKRLSLAHRFDNKQESAKQEVSL